jgi:metal-responsive CopG/Arc/MetJ family transcriptional regulator
LHTGVDAVVMVRTNVTLPAEVLDEIDELAGPRGRSAYVAEAVLAKVKRDRIRRALDETYGAAVGHSQWKDADEAYRWVRSLREDQTREDRIGGRGR